MDTVETAKILNFPVLKNRTASTAQPKQVKIKTTSELHQEALNSVEFEWKLAADKNRVNEFFLMNLTDQQPETSAVLDLNFISKIERRLEIPVLSMSPASSKSNPDGWLISFKIGDDILSSPPMFENEKFS